MLFPAGLLSQCFAHLGPPALLVQYWTPSLSSHCWTPACRYSCWTPSWSFALLDPQFVVTATIHLALLRFRWTPSWQLHATLTTFLLCRFVGMSGV
jgi:hypothetical protein